MDSDKDLSMLDLDDTGPRVEIATDVFCLTNMIVNIIFIGYPGTQTGGWVLVDAGIQNSVDDIRGMAEERFNTPPDCIVLTHGHFDHVGAIEELLKVWGCPVYAHERELPYLTGQKDYDPPDPSVGGGLLARLSSVFPRSGINLGERIKSLPADGTIPFLPGWRWLETPGHTPGHISLFREADRILIAGDAITTVKQESALAVLTQEKEVHGPPAYFTTDWDAAWQSVKRLYELNPFILISSHGQPLSGDQLQEQLADLAAHFDTLAIPAHGRYVH